MSNVALNNIQIIQRQIVYAKALGSFRLKLGYSADYSKTFNITLYLHRLIL